MLLPKDYVRFQLTGEFASDVSDASGTALFDVVQRRWSFEMVDALGWIAASCPRYTNRARSQARSQPKPRAKLDSSRARR